MNKNYYAILQIPGDSKRDDIQKAYRRLAKKYHPDVNKSPDAHEKFCEITEAYEFLMNHWPLHVEQYANNGSYEQMVNKYRQTVEYEHFQQEARERAQQQAKMRYEKFRQQHEAFQESGINDIALLLTVLIRTFGMVLFFCLLFTPVILTFLMHWTWIFTILFMWPFAIVIVWYYHDNRKNYFLPGQFYYSYNRIKHLFTDKHQSLQYCYYCPRNKADSKPYKIDLLKLKDVKLKSSGYRQHNVNYLNQAISIVVPRSQKAFTIHSINILLKLLSLLNCLIFLNISSIVWRIIIGMVLGGILSRILLIITRTKSNVTYLYSYGLLLRVSCWLIGISLVSRFTISPFNINTDESIHFVITAIVIFDCFFMQIISLLLGKYAARPISMQFPEATTKFSEGYVVYNDVPVISFVYPLFKWFFG